MMWLHWTLNLLSWIIDCSQLHPVVLYNLFLLRHNFPMTKLTIITANFVSFSSSLAFYEIEFIPLFGKFKTFFMIDYSRPE